VGIPPVENSDSISILHEGRVLLVQQCVSEDRRWSLPGGSLGLGETLERAVLREVEEETGLTTSVRRLLYVADKPEDELVYISFELALEGGTIRLPDNKLESSPISDVRSVPIGDLTAYGFSAKWRDLVLASFVDAPRYVGYKESIGL